MFNGISVAVGWFNDLCDAPYDAIADIIGCFKFRVLYNIPTLQEYAICVGSADIDAKSQVACVVIIILSTQQSMYPVQSSNPNNRVIFIHCL